eukprot:6184604-Prymnesium_polylepis.2
MHHSTHTRNVTRCKHEREREEERERACARPLLHQRCSSVSVCPTAGPLLMWRTLCAMKAEHGRGTSNTSRAHAASGMHGEPVALLCALCGSTKLT